MRGTLRNATVLLTKPRERKGGKRLKRFLGRRIRIIFAYLSELRVLCFCATLRSCDVLYLAWTIWTCFHKPPSTAIAVVAVIDCQRSRKSTDDYSTESLSWNGRAVSPVLVWQTARQLFEIDSTALFAEQFSGSVSQRPLISLARLDVDAVCVEHIKSF
jgi:hypothetical protein